MHRTVRIKITELNPNLICVLCGGYYIDACTIIECLHSFCRTCITKYLESSKYCPICDAMVHKTKPLLYVKSDKTLQDLVYKLVPGLYKNEMKRRREYYGQLPSSTAGTSRPSCNTEERGYEDPDRLIYTADEKISLSLELLSDIVPSEAFKADCENNPDCLKKRDVRYLQCPAAVSMSHLKKFLRLKFELPSKYKIDVYHSDEPLKDYFTLMDVAYIYMWRRTAPLRLVYIVYEKTPKKRKCTGTAEMARVLKQARITTDEEEQEEKAKSLQSEKSENGNGTDTQIGPCMEKSKEVRENESCDDKSGEEKGDKCDDIDDRKDMCIGESESKVNGSTSPKPDENVSPSVNGVECHDVESIKDSGNVQKTIETNAKVGNTPKKTNGVDKSPAKICLNGKYSPKLCHNGKVFSPTFYRKQKGCLNGNEEPLDMTKKTLKEAKKGHTFSLSKLPYVDNNSNGNPYRAFDFTD